MLMQARLYEYPAGRQRRRWLTGTVNIGIAQRLA